MRNFAYAGDLKNKLIVKSPMAGTNKGLVSSDIVWDNCELSLGFRVLFDNVTTTQYLFYNTEQASSKNENYTLAVNEGKMYWCDPTNGALEILSGLVTGVLYNMWLEIAEEELVLRCISSEGYIQVNAEKTAYYATDSYMCIMNHRSGTQPLLGTMFDIVTIGGMGYGFEIFQAGGISWLGTSNYWSCREAGGNSIICKITGVELTAGHFSGFDWRTTVQDDCKKWS